MHCDEFESRLNELLDERHAPRRNPALRAHAAVCAPCEALLRGYESLLDAVDALETPVPAAGFAAQVVSQGLALAHPQPTRRRSRHAQSMALAAALLVAALPGLFWLTAGSRPLPREPVAAAALRNATADERMTAQAGIRQTAREDETGDSQQRSLASIRQSLLEVLDYLPAADSQPSPAMAAADGPSSKWASEIHPGAEPLAITAGRSIVALFQVMPNGMPATSPAALEQ